MLKKIKLKSAKKIHMTSFTINEKTLSDIALLTFKFQFHAIFNMNKIIYSLFHFSI